MDTELIIVSEFCQKSRIEPSFIVLLEEFGLIDIQEENEEKYILFSQLSLVERYARLYYDLSVNMEGIDVIRHLLGRIEEMQKEIVDLRNRMDYFSRH